MIQDSNPTLVMISLACSRGIRGRATTPRGGGLRGRGSSRSSCLSTSICKIIFRVFYYRLGLNKGLRKLNQAYKMVKNPLICTGMNTILGSKVQCLCCFETSTAEGRGGEMGGSANSKTKNTEPLTQGLCSPL